MPSAISRRILHIGNGGLKPEGAIGMRATLTLIDLAGAIALLIWGVHMVQTGVTRAFGPRLRRILNQALGNRCKAFLAGLGVTAILQSSTATGLMVSAFAAGGFVDLVPALAVMLGANVGTTLIVQVLSFDVSPVSFLLILLGVLMFRRSTVTCTRDLGRVGIGLGLMMLALQHLLAMITPYEDVPSLRMLLGAITTEPLIDVLLAAGLTWAAHSSVAVVLLIMTFAVQGIVPPHAAFALVLGANLGTAINPLLESGVSGRPGRQAAAGRQSDQPAPRLRAGSPAARLDRPGPRRDRSQSRPGRRRFSHRLQHLLGAAVLPGAEAVRQIADACSCRRASIWPILRSRCTSTARPARHRASRSREPPAKRCEWPTCSSRCCAARSTRSITPIASGSLKPPGWTMCSTGSTPAIKEYLTSLDIDALDDTDHRRLSEILAFTTNLEHAGDIVEKSLMPLAAKRIKRGVVFSEAGRQEIRDMIERLMSNARAAAAVFMTEDLRARRGS